MFLGFFFPLFLSQVENGWFLSWFFFDPFSSRVCLLIFTVCVCSFFQFKPREVYIWCVLDVSMKLSLQWVFVKCWRERSQPNKKLTVPDCNMAYITLPRPIPTLGEQSHKASCSLLCAGVSRWDGWLWLGEQFFHHGRVKGGKVAAVCYKTWSTICSHNI